ncbi:MAG: glycosyltransferase family 2 protein [Candidatus Ratteibacteria bacterium]|nr:glycosyltransferase family 2 protein [Candidatus Ratteibacteria bacterium]
MENPKPEISVVLPCLNEEDGLGFCLDDIKKVIKDNKLNAEVIVVDNGSTDKSCQIAIEKQVRLIHEKEEGYGAACLKGLYSAQGKYLFLADADGTYDFHEVPKFIEQLRKGYDFVIGSRFEGNIGKTAMSWSHKYIGNPLLSGTLRLFFKTRIRDTHCGMRALTKDALDKLNLRAKGMEFASEMVIKAIKSELKIKEIPINYYERKGRSKLKTFADGWRHLRFMLLYSPLFLFFIPGIILFVLGMSSMLWMYLGTPEILGIKFHYHPMFLSALLVITGYQLIIFSLFAKTYAVTHLGEKATLNDLYKYLTIEKAGIAGILMVIPGIIIYILIFSKWLNGGFGELIEIKNSIVALTLIIMGIQTIFSSFMLSILGIKGE